MTRPHNVPQADEQALANILRIQAERAFSADGKDLAIDYVARGEWERQRSVLLVAASKRRIEQATELAAAAGLHVAAVTCSATALGLAGATAEDRGPNVIVQANPDATELALRDEKRFRVVRHLSVAAGGEASGGSAGWVDALTRELRRVIATEAADGPSMEGARLTLWDGVGIEAEGARCMAERLGLSTDSATDLPRLAKVNGAAGAQPHAGRFAAAVALARAGTDEALLAVDFLHSRLAPPKTSRFDMKWRLGTIAAVGLALIVGYLYSEYRAEAVAVAQLQADLQAQRPTVEAAEAIIGKVRHAGGYFDQRPACLECLLRLTGMFPEEGRIWATDLSIREDLEGNLSGRATDDRSILEVMEHMQRSEHFSGVQLKKMGVAGRNQSELAFNVTFRFEPAE